MPWGAAVAAVGALGAASMGSSASKKAAKQGERAQREAIALQREMWNTTRNDLAPYRDAGTTALPSLIDVVTNPQAQADYVQTNPLYRAAAGQASEELMANQAARGKLGSGSTASALQQQYLALGDQFLNNQTNRLFGLVGIGQNSAAGTAAANQQTSNALTDLITGAGASRAAGTVGSTNAWAPAIEGVAQIGGNYLQRYLNRQGGANNTPVSTTTNDYSYSW